MFCQEEFDEARGRKRTREHVIADWMAPYLKSPEGPGTMVRWRSTAENRREDPQSYRGYPAQQAVQGVCAKCNSGWLSQIQTAAKPALLSALQSPRQRTFGLPAQEAMGMWAYRAALVIGVKAGNAQIPIEHLHEFYETRKVPKSTRIWMVATGHRKYTYIEHRLLAIRPEGEPPASVNAFATLLAVGHVGFYVVRWTETKPRSGIGRVFDVFEDAVVPIFPSRGLAVWPAKQILNHGGLDHLAEVMGVWERR